MKMTFKKMLISLAAAVMCAVPMTSAMTASAKDPYGTYVTREAKTQVRGAKVRDASRRTFKGNVNLIKGVKGTKSSIRLY